MMEKAVVHVERIAPSICQMGVVDLRAMTALYASEINCSLATSHDGGLRVRLGDLNGFDAEETLTWPDLDRAARWLAEEASSVIRNRSLRGFIRRRSYRREAHALGAPARPCH